MGRLAAGSLARLQSSMSDAARRVGGMLGARWRLPTLSHAARRWAALALVVTLAYYIVFATTRPGGPDRWAVYTLRNVLPLVLLAGAARAVLLRHAVGKSAVRQALVHALLAGCFSLGWFWLLTIAGGLFDGASPTEFTVKRFLWGAAAEWQLFQGLFAYAALAALVELEARPTQLAPPAEAAPVKPARLLVRSGDEVMPIDPADIVAITGADDYSELTTRTGRHLVRTTLAEFTDMLDPGRFLRVHRSAIVNLDRVVRAEPAGGGRLLLHMEAGGSIQASRAGARLVRERLL